MVWRVLNVFSCISVILLLWVSRNVTQYTYKFTENNLKWNCAGTLNHIYTNNAQLQRYVNACAF